MYIRPKDEKLHSIRTKISKNNPGFGNCCVYIPSHVLSGLYFDKYRSLATGISNSGSGLGGAIMPVLVGLFIDMFSWKGSLIILAGLNLHLFIFCALLRMPPPMPSCHVGDMEMDVVKPSETAGSLQDAMSLIAETNTETDPVMCSSERILTRFTPSTNDVISTSDESQIKIVVEDYETMEDDIDYNFICLDIDKNRLNVSQEMDSFRTRSTSSQGFTTESASQLDTHPSSLLLFTDNRVMLKSRSFVQPHATISKTNTLESRPLFLCDKSSSLQQSAVMGWRGSCLVFNNKDSKPHIKLSEHDIIKENEKTRVAITDRNKNHDSSTYSTTPKSSQHIFIFTNYAFDIYFLSNMMWNAGYTIIQAFAPKFMIEKGVTSLEAAWLSGAFGFGSFVGGIIGACCGNIRRVNRKLLYAFANVGMGLIILLFPNYPHTAFFAATLISSGLAFGLILGLLVIVLIDLVGPQSLGNGIGYLMLSNGVGAFIGPPVASLLRETTGGFEAAILLAGCLCILGGLVMLLMPCGDLQQTSACDLHLDLNRVRRLLSRASGRRKKNGKVPRPTHV